MCTSREYLCGSVKPVMAKLGLEPVEYGVAGSRSDFENLHSKHYCISSIEVPILHGTYRDRTLHQGL